MVVGSKRPIINANNRKTCLTIGNPPFGKNSTLAVKFFNRAAQFSDIIAFVLPNTFIKQSIKNKLDCSFILLSELPLPINSFTLENNLYHVPCVFQIWTHTHSMDFINHVYKQNVAPRQIKKDLIKVDDFNFVKVLDNPDFIIRRNGALAGKIFTENLEKWTTNNHYFIKVNDKNNIQKVLNKLKALDLENTPIKYATAGYPSIGKAELCALYVSSS